MGGIDLWVNLLKKWKTCTKRLLRDLEKAFIEAREEDRYLKSRGV